MLIKLILLACELLVEPVYHDNIG
ncbi:MAG: hypothetical protein Q620_VSAC00778G0001, partial [Veillonella sp. DORA_A_3_16_22]